MNGVFSNILQMERMSSASDDRQLNSLVEFEDECVFICTEITPGKYTN